MLNEVKIWIVNWLEDYSEVSGLNSQSDLYNDALLDSMGIMEFIEAIESQFAFQFSEEDLINPMFRKVDDIASIVLKHIAI